MWRKLLAGLGDIETRGRLWIEVSRGKAELAVVYKEAVIAPAMDPRSPFS